MLKLKHCDRIKKKLYVKISFAYLHFNKNIFKIEEK